MIIPMRLEDELLIEHLRSLRAALRFKCPSMILRHTAALPTGLRWNRGRLYCGGILVLVNPLLREMFDLKVFVDTDSDVRYCAA